MSSFSRRQFFHSATGAATIGLSAAVRSTAQQPSAPIKPSLSPFGYSQVQLLPGPLKQQFDQNHEFFLNLSEDRVLKIFRQRAGQPAPGEWMSIWYDEFCPGAHFGQYVSALARFSAATGSAETRAKTQRLVRGYAQTLDPTGKIFADLRYPAYTYDKIVLMLIDADSYAGERDAAALLKATTRACKPHMAEKALTPAERHDRPHKDESYLWDETYTLAENLFLASDHFGDGEYFDMGQRYLLDQTFFNPLADGQNPLPGLHAYSHMNALSSGVQGYLKLGGPKYLRGVTHAVDLIWNDQSYATGGWGPNEQFVKPGTGALGQSLSTTHRSFETPCGAYAHFKLMRYMTSITRDSRYGDSLEKVLYNTVLGATPITPDGSSFYYSDYHDSGSKAHRRVIPDARYAWDLDGRWPCCSGTLPMVAADYVISLYQQSNDGVYVNLFVPSRLSWTRDGAQCTMTQQTSYPTANLTSFDMQLTAPRQFTLYLRVPAWAGRQTSVSVNGRRVSGIMQPGQFYPLARTWQSGDKVEFEIDQTLRTEAVDQQTPDRMALLRGPQVLFAVTNAPLIVNRRELESIQIRPAEADTWSYSQGQTNISLRPFWRVGDEVYQTYWKVAPSA